MTTRSKTFARTKSKSRRDARSFGFNSSELRTVRALKSPAGIQRFLDELPYNLSFTARSPQKVLYDRTASCLEGGIFAAAALRVIGFRPLIFDLEAEQDTDHVVAIFKRRGHWGAVAKSNFTGCRYREPVYRNLRELAMSYFNVYFNLSRRSNAAAIFTSGESRPLRSSQLDGNGKTDLVHRRISLRNSAHPATRASDGKTPYASRFANDQRRNGRSSKKIGMAE